MASLAVPLLFLACTAWYDHRRLMAEARTDIIRLAAIAKEHALKVVETNALVLDRLEDRIRGLDWEAIAVQGEAIHRTMHDMDEPIAQITALHLVRPDGRVVVGSAIWPTPPIDLSDRPYFRSMAAGEAGIVFGEPTRSRFSGTVSFSMARRRETSTAHQGETPEGRFDGAVIGAVLPGYFQAHWQELDPEGRMAIALMRIDGQVLAMHPRPDSDLMPPPDPGVVPQALRQVAGIAPVVERLGDRGQWLAAAQRVGAHPLMVRVSLSLDEVRTTWLLNTMVTGALCLVAAMALAAVTLLSVRRWRSEQAMLHRLVASAAALRAEIARREAAEADLVQAQRLEALGHLTGGVAHDFNNLLTAILGTLHLLERHLGTGADERTRRLLGMGRDAVNRGARLNASLLAFARRQTLNTAPLDVNALVEGFTPLLQRALGETVTLAMALQPGLPVARADAAQLEAALLNLAINARDAMPAGGQVMLSTRRTWLSAAELAGNPEARPGDYVAVALADSGIGMPAEVRDRAFEPFFTTKPVGKGTGLGLSQVFGFIRQLGGHVAIDSAPGAGTKVTLFLAADIAGAASPTPVAPPRREVASAPPLGAGQASVLLVEDDARVRDLVAETLREAGFRVLAVTDGKQALAVLRQEGRRVEVLFSDIVMPGGLSGIALAQEARRLRPGLPVLLATGYADSVSEGEEHGWEVMPKPYDQEAVVRRIAALAAARVDRVGA